MPDDPSTPTPGTPGPPPALPALPTPAAPAPPPRAGGWRPRPHRSAAALLVLALLATAAAVGGWLSSNPGSGSSGGPSDARRTVDRALAAARGAGSFHYVSSSSDGTTTQLTVGDAGPTQGRQAIEVGGTSFNVLVVGSTAYFRGDALAMVQNLGVPATVARAHAAQWISLAPGDAPYASVYAAVTTADALKDNVTFTPAEVLGSTTVTGRHVLAVRGAVQGIGGAKARGTATLYLSTGRAHLPVRYVEQGRLLTGGSGTPLHFTIDFSAWGEAVSAAAPGGAVAYSSLGVPGGPAPGSTPSTLLT